MKLYMIRHGESETNVLKCFTGWLDAPLTEKGEADAELIRPFLSKIHFDKIFSSDLIRAKTTAQIALPGCEPEYTPLLREIDGGTLAGKPLSTPMPEGYSLFRDGYSCFGGESRQDVFDRAKEFLSEISKLDCDCVAAFSHSGFIKSTASVVLGFSKAGEHIPLGQFVCNNCAIAIFEYKNGVWKLYGWLNTDDASRI